MAFSILNIEPFEFRVFTPQDVKMATTYGLKKKKKESACAILAI